MVCSRKQKCNVTVFLCNVFFGSRDGAVVRALASHQCGPGSNPGVDAICGLSLLLVLSLAPRGFSPGTPVFPSPQKPTLPNSNYIWNARTSLNEFRRTPKCLVGKQNNYDLQFFFTIELAGESLKNELAAQRFQAPIKTGLEVFTAFRGGVSVLVHQKYLIYLTRCLKQYVVKKSHLSRKKGQLTPGYTHLIYTYTKKSQTKPSVANHRYYKTFSAVIMHTFYINQ